MTMGTGMALDMTMAIVFQMMAIPTMKKSMATAVPLLSLPITTTIQTLGSNMMMRNHC
jgi:hypothetical protein